MIIRNIIIISLFLLAAQPADAQFWKKNKKDKTEDKKSNSDQDDSMGQYYFIQGMGKFLKEDYSDAIKKFNEALSFSKKNPAIHYKIADCYNELSMLTKAEEHARKAIKFGPKNEHYYLLLISILSKDFEFDEITATYEKLLENVPSSAKHYMDLGKLYKEMGTREQSKLEIYRKSADDDRKKEKQIKERIEAYFQKAREAFERYADEYGASVELTKEIQFLNLSTGREEKAIEQAIELIKNHPDEEELVNSQLDIIFNNGGEEQVISFLKEFIQEEREHPLYLMKLFEFYKKTGQEAEAAEVLSQAFESKRMDVDTKVKLVSAYLQQANTNDRVQEAIDLAKKTVEAHPKKAQAYSVLGDAYYVGEERRNARDAYLNAVALDSSKKVLWEQVLRLDSELTDLEQMTEHAGGALKAFPEHAQFWLMKGLANVMLKNDKEAVKAFEEGVKYAEEASLRSRFYAHLGDSYNNLSRYEDSYEAYEEVLSYDPNNAHVLNNYSYFLSLQEKDLDYAKSMSHRLIMMHPDDPTYLDTHGWVLYKLEDYEGAKKHLERALEYTDDGTVVEHYGDVMFKLGKVSEAVEYWKKAKETGSASELISDKIKDQKLYEN